MDFDHPLARGAKVWKAKLRTGETKDLLVIMTNIELSSEKERFNPRNMERLVHSAEEYIDENPDIDGYVLANRMRDWENSKDRK